MKIVFKNPKPLGNGLYEVPCNGCNEPLIVGERDDVFYETNEKGESFVLCSKCYSGPRASRLSVEDAIKEITREDD